MKKLILSLLLVLNISVTNAQTSANNITAPAPEENLIHNKIYFLHKRFYSVYFFTWHFEKIVV